MAAQDLVDKISQYNSAVNADLITRAYYFAERRHRGQKRHSGDDFFSHPEAVADILADHMQDDWVIAAGLLHDTVEDTETSQEEIAEEFGEMVAEIVSGVTRVARKLSGGELRGVSFPEFTRSADFRVLVEATGRINQVMVVKCADRLHNLRTSQKIDEQKRLKKARESIGTLAPLAAMCGFQKISRELEDAAFAILRPNEVGEIRRKFVRLRGKKQSPSPENVAAREFHTELIRKLKAAKIEAELSSRLKTPYSIWRKHRGDTALLGPTEDETPVHEWIGSIFDVFGFRIVTRTVEDAYNALGVVHRNWPARSDRFKDYISTPKETNGYQSIHTVVELPTTGAVEIQIRTAEMHFHAEYGSAAHWAYRGGVLLGDEAGKRGNAVQVLIDETLYSNKGEISDSEFMKSFNAAVTVRRFSIACFTPKGRTIRLPFGSSALDFAFAVHSKLGERAVAAKVGGRRVELNATLSNGDRVEIISAIDASPRPEWLDWVKTARAKSEIRRSLHRAERQQLINLGLRIADEALKAYGREASEEVLKIAAANVFKEGGDVDQLLLMLGRSERRRSTSPVPANIRQARASAENAGKSPKRATAGVELTGEDVVRAVLPETFLKVDPKVTEPENFFIGLPDNSDPHIAPCCLPVPKEDVIGVVRPSGRLRVHRADCREIPWGCPSTPIVKSFDWHEGPFVPIHPAAVVASLANRTGVLGRICNLIGEQNSNISDLLFVERKQSEYRILFEVQVRDCNHLEHVLSAMKTDVEVRYANRCMNALLLKKSVLESR